jgi:methyltransferase (TIGR00027 family)
MIEGEPSRTARGAAMRRAAHQLLDEPKLFDDPLAFALLGTETAAALRANLSAQNEDGSMHMRAFLAARARYVEDELAEAVARGIRRYAVLGAGLDTFAYRNPHVDAGLTVYEIDHPATQDWKRQRLREAGIALPASLTFAPVDFEKQTLSEGLQAAGLGGEPVFFSWLGVTPYLTLEAVNATLASIAAMPEGSSVIFDFPSTRDKLTAAQRASFERRAARVAALGEPWISEFDPAALAETMRGMGFRSAEAMGREAINARYFAGRADGLRVGGNGHLMKAVV